MKISAFIWKVLHNGIAVDQNIVKLGVRMASKCHCCSSPNIESRDHLLIRSELASIVWNHFSVILNLPLAFQSVENLLLSWFDQASFRNQIGVEL